MNLTDSDIKERRRIHDLIMRRTGILIKKGEFWSRIPFCSYGAKYAYAADELLKLHEEIFGYE